MTATATASPTVTPSPTATPGYISTPVPTPTSAALSDVIQLSVNIATTTLPADNQSQAVVEARVTSSDDYALDNLTIGFQIQGSGQLSRTRVPLIDNRATTIYTAGESAGRSTVRISALLDYPALGRIRAEDTLQLVRETLSLSMPGCAYYLPQTIDRHLLPFSLNSVEDLGGRYNIRATLSDNRGTLALSDSTRPDSVLSLAVAPGQHTLQYTPPDTDNLLSALCLTLPLRSDVPRTCHPLVRALPVTQIAVQTASVVAPGSPLELRFQALQDRQAVATRTTLQYDVLTDQASARHTLARLASHTQPLTAGTCEILDTPEGIIYQGFRASDTPTVLRWFITAPGATDPVQISTDTIVSPGALTRIQINAPIELNDGGYIQPGTPANEPALFIAGTADPITGRMPIIVRLYLQAASSTTSRYRLYQASGHPASPADWQLAIPLDSPSLSPECLPCDSARYFTGSIATSAVQSVP